MFSDQSPLLLMDQVGIGKTMQLVGLIAVIAYFIDYHDKNHKFPGAYGKHLFWLALFATSRHRGRDCGHLLRLSALAPIVSAFVPAGCRQISVSVTKYWFYTDKRKFHNGNIPKRPSVIVVPTALLSQWTAYLHKYLEKLHFDVLPYEATTTNRGNWIKDILGRSQQPPHRQIIVATHSVSAWTYKFLTC